MCTTTRGYQDVTKTGQEARRRPIENIPASAVLEFPQERPIVPFIDGAVNTAVFVDRIETISVDHDIRAERTHFER